MIGVASVVCAPLAVIAQDRSATVQIREDTFPPAPEPPVPVHPGGAAKPAKKAVWKPVDKDVRVAQPVVELKGLRVVNGVAERWARQFRPILQVEYLFMKTVCDPTREERIAIASAGFKALDEAVKKYVDWLSHRNRQGLPAGGRADFPDVRQWIQDGLMAAVKVQLTPSQAERYRVELEARSAEVKRVAILNFVAKLDRALLLSADQRTKLTDLLSAQWYEAWTLVLQNYNLDDEYVPTIPEPLISQFLNDDQKSVWARFQKVSFNAMGVMNISLAAGDMNQENAPLDDEFSDAVAKGESKPESKK